jgi:DNA invertase Pin-like site-specific DNA recombinase
MGNIRQNTVAKTPSHRLLRPPSRGTVVRVPAKIGYARVSTDEQNLHLQHDALKQAGCARIYTDKGISGAEFSRPGLDRALATLRPGDTLLVWRLDRLGRSLTKLVELVNFLDEQQVDFISITEAINTLSPGGVLVFHLMAALAQFERSLISERTRAGLVAAKARGKRLGRRCTLSDAQRCEALRLTQSLPIAAVAAQFNVHPRTLRRWVETHRLTQADSIKSPAG